MNLYYVILTKLDFPEFSSLRSSVNVGHKWHFVSDLESRSETGVVSFLHEAGGCRGPRSGGTSLTVTLVCWLSMLASGNSWVHSSSCFCYSCSTYTFSSRMECQLLLWTVCFIKVRGLGAVRDWLGSGPSCGCKLVLTGAVCSCFPHLTSHAFKQSACCLWAPAPGTKTAVFYDQPSQLRRVLSLGYILTTHNHSQ